jgi:Rrf2 family transcriptional regulator, nitric oxide-sensitive transcriptional repressor
MFSQTVEYALRAVVYLSHDAPSPHTTEQIAEATKVPKAYLSKVLQLLRRANLVISQRGVGGGVALAKMPVEILVLDIINAVEPLQRITSCPLGLPTHSEQLCPLHTHIDNALAQLETTLRATNIAMILKAGGNTFPLCAATCNLAAVANIDLTGPQPIA